MEKIDEFRNTLAMPLSKLSIDKLVREICLHPEYLKDMYQLISDDKIVVSWRAIWACEKVSEQHPGWFVPLQDDIIRRLLTCRHDGSKRLFLSILYNVPEKNHTYEIGYLIGEEEYLNRGIGKIIIRKLEEKIIGLGGHEISADPSEENTVSIKVLLSNGFKKKSDGDYRKAIGGM